ncbi:glycosyltransferase family 4 protein, partial [Candidatus Sumerlaeota bacterium]|nr:glycosyltransferase family 4 protein [Candidatus Sumerlaeota bacterium]
MKLRIVHVASHEGVYRGGAVQVGRIASAQSRSGHEVAVVAYESPHKTAAMRDLDRSSWARLTKAGVPVIFMNYSGWMGALRLRLEIQRRDAQIVHAHRDPALMACNRALWRMDAPALIAQRGTIKPPPKEVAQILGSPRTRGVVAVANAVRNVLTRSYICPTERVEVIYGSVDMEEFAPRPPKAELRRAAGIPDDAQILGSLSAYRRAKGLELLLKAMKELADSQPRLHALFLGQETEEKLRPVAKELGLE